MTLPTTDLVGKFQQENMSRKLMKFLILFDNSNLLFFPGQFLSGRVILEVDDDMPVLGKLHFFYFFFSLTYFVLFYKKIFIFNVMCNYLNNEIGILIKS